MLKEKGVVTRYAAALFEVASAAEIVEPVRDDLELIASILRDNARYSKLMMSRYSPYAVKTLFVRTALSGADIAPITSNFLKELLSNNRMHLLYDVVREFALLVLSEAGISIVELVIERKDDAFVGLVHAALSEQSEVVLHVTEDATILGGFVLKLSGRVVDCSLKSRLQKLSKVLINMDLVMDSEGLGR